ncbi:sporulation histidine kinase inhibitor Sda [Paenibacillus sp. CN-4]
MVELSDELLLDSYYRALELQLEHDFIALLLVEIRKRNLHSPCEAVVH